MGGDLCGYANRHVHVLVLGAESSPCLSQVVLGAGSSPCIVNPRTDTNYITRARREDRSAVLFFLIRYSCGLNYISKHNKENLDVHGTCFSQILVVEARSSRPATSSICLFVGSFVWLFVCRSQPCPRRKNIFAFLDLIQSAFILSPLQPQP